MLGMRGSSSAMLGEARWQERPLGQRDITRLSAKVAAVPHPVDEPLLVLWGRGGLDPRLKSDHVRGYELSEMLESERER